VAGWISKLLGDPQPGAPQSDTERFWAWFTKSRAFLERRLVTQSFKAAHFEEGMKLLPDGMEWEIGRAADEKFELTLSGGGPLQDRRVAGQLVQAAPAFERWRFFPARQPSGSGFVLQRDGVECDPDEARFSLELDELRRVAHVRVRHPCFKGIDPTLAKGLAYQLLDMILGEDAVETWVGAVEAGVGEVLPELDVKALRAAIGDLREAELQWTLLREKGDGKPRLVRVCPGLKPRHWLAFDQHLTVTESYQPADDGGLPDGETLESLDQAEDQLLATLGERAVFHGRELTEGRCVWHFHGDAAAEEALRTWTARHLPKAVVARTQDLAWDQPEWREG
jgi:hypothetical protein